MKASTRPQTYRVKNFGCQMNVYDGERIGELLTENGINEAVEGEDADLVVLNTCHIREKAAEKIYSDIGRLTKGKTQKISPMIAVAGCVAQAEGDEIMVRAPSVSMVVGPQAYHRLPDMLDKAVFGERVTDTEMPAITKFDSLPKRRRSSPTAFLTVQEGCDKFCTYCVVPYTRGSEISRPFNDLIDESYKLVDSGAREITLLGQNVNAWSGEDGKGKSIGLAGLITALAKIPDLARIRYTTSHPNDMDQALIAAHGEVEKLMPYLHLPVQSGSNRILQKMNRSHTVQAYLSLLDRFKQVRPDIAFSGDFIVGFPGETEDDFNDTLNLVSEVGYSQAFSFKYSARPGTPAAGMQEQIDRETMNDRLQRLQAKLNRDQYDFDKNIVGKFCEVLVERKGKLEGQWLGKSPWLTSVWFEGDAKIGDLIKMRIIDAGPNSLQGAVK